MDYSLNKKALLWGALFGLLAPLLGLFLGLQISVVFANILLWPALVMSALFSAPLGDWSIELMIAGMLVSIVTWSLIFAVLHMFIRNVRS